MFDIAGKAFFGALRGVVAMRLGSDHPCFAAVEWAAVDGGADATLAAQGALNALGAETAAALMADAHKALRENPAAVLGVWQPLGIRH